jgi:DNA-binding GntR family transcriptional regulator
MLIKVSRTPATRGEEVYDVLRSQLLNGVLRPGQKLRMVELAGRFGVSQSVVREALTRLGERGLVVASPQRGFRVRELSVADIAELTELRVEIETVALRLAIDAATSSGRRALSRLFTSSNAHLRRRGVGSSTPRLPSRFDRRM